MSQDIRKILIISLSNIGDIVLTMPVMDILLRDFPGADIDIIIGPKGASLFAGNHHLRKVMVYHKGQSGLALWQWIRQLAAQRYDLAVDLRNTAIPFLIFAKRRTPIMFSRPRAVHMRQQHLLRLKTVHDFASTASERRVLSFSRENLDFVANLLASNPAVSKTKYVVIAPGARAENKRWPAAEFARLADHLIETYQVMAVFAGDSQDSVIVKDILARMQGQALDVTGQLNLNQLGIVISKARLVISNDSAPLHLAGYLDVPVVVFFGPTDPGKYGPWSPKGMVLRNNSACAACAGQRNAAHDCMAAISAGQAIASLTPFLSEVLRG